MLELLRAFTGGHAIMPNKDKVLSDGYAFTESRVSYLKANPKVVGFHPLTHA